MKNIVYRAKRMLRLSKKVTPEVMKDLVDSIIDEFDVHMIKIRNHKITFDEEECIVTFDYEDKFNDDYYLILDFVRGFVQSEGCLVSLPTIYKKEVSFRIRKFNMDDFANLTSIISFNEEKHELVRLSNYIQFEFGNPFEGTFFYLNEIGECYLDISGSFKSESQYKKLMRIIGEEHIECSSCTPHDKRYTDKISIKL